MRFSLYTEIQLHPGKTAEQMYAEVLEQIDNADRLGYDAYAAIEIARLAGATVIASAGGTLTDMSGPGMLRLSRRHVTAPPTSEERR